MNNVSSNAVAGPSTPREPSSPIPPTPSSVPHDPPLFLPPPGASQPTGYLASTQDLLQRFQLLSAYEKYVRPFAAPAETGFDQAPPPTQIAHSTPATDKGKGKEGGSGGVNPTQGAGVAGVGDDDDDGPHAGKGDKKRKNNYKHLIKGIPGKHSMKKDDYLTTLILVPPKQRARITPFDARTQRDAFTVSLEGLKNWNTGTLILGSPQAREDRKQRKEAKRLAKAQAAAAAAGLVQGAPAASPQVPIRAPIPTSVSAPSALNRPAAGTPQPNTSGAVKTGSYVARPGSTVSRPGSAVPRPGSAVPRPGSGSSGRPVNKPPVTPANSSPIRTTTPANGHAPSASSGVPQRGTKRERDDSVASTGVNGTAPPVTNGYTNGNAIPGHGANGTVPAVTNVRAGVPGVRPRPVKKQRMDLHGGAREVVAAVQQQPTPQGV